MSASDELRSVDLTEALVRRYEAMHEAIKDANGSLSMALVLLRARALEPEHPARGVKWDLPTLLRELESKEYNVWSHAFGSVMAAHTLWSGFTALSDPDNVPKSVAANVLRLAGGREKAPEKLAPHQDAKSAAQDLKKDMLG